MPSPARTIRRAAPALAALLLAACGDATGPASLVGPAVTVRTERTAYRPMDLVTITTTNNSSRTVWDDHCGGELQGLEYLGRWNGSYGSGRACVDLRGADDWRARAIPIPPGGTHVDVLHVNGSAYTGTWRAELLLRDDAGRLLPSLRRTSNTFRVTGDWSP